MIPEVKKIKINNDISLHANIIENGSPVWIIVTHGLGEYGQRHSYMYKLFSQYFNICTYDLRGHGLSGGKRAYIENFDDYATDLDEVIHFLEENYSMKRFVLFGHSMGGLVTANYMQNFAQDSSYPEKVFLSGPAAAGPGVMGKAFSLAPMSFMKRLKTLPASIPLAGLLDIKKLSHDPRVYEAYIKDENVSVKVHTKLIFEVLSKGREVFSRPLRVKCDLYCAVATSDALIDPGKVISYFSEFEKNTKLLKVEGSYHEIHNEVEKFKKPYLKFLKDSIMDSIYT